MTAIRISLGDYLPFWDLFHHFSPVGIATIYYFLAFWFKLFHPSLIHFFLGSVFLGMASLPLLYFFYRRLAGVPVAMAGIFFLAAMRWHWTYSRDGHPAVEVPLYIGMALVSWIYAVDSMKKWAFLPAGMALAAGLYSYQDLKVLPCLLLIYTFYEWRRCAPFRRKEFLRNAMVYFGAFSVFSIPIFRLMIQWHGIGYREEELVAFPLVLREKGWFRGVWDQVIGTAFAFNRAGDTWFYHNIPGHRMLDDVTGILFVLGLGYALFRFKERSSFYAIMGFLAFCLPAFLSVNPNHASRLMGTVPFIVLLCAESLVVLYGAFSAVAGKFKHFLAPALGLVLIFCVYENFRDYFWIQARNEACWLVNGGASASWIGNAIANDQEDDTYLVCSRFYGHFDIGFLAFSRLDRIFPLSLPQSMDLKDLPKGKGVCLALDQGHTGVLGLFQSLYPGGNLKTLRTPQGVSVAYFYRIPAEEVEHSRGMAGLPRDFGLEGTYRALDSRGGRRTLRQVDPILNFTFRNDFPLRNFPPLDVRWKGWLTALRGGNYRFLILTTDRGGLELDGKSILSPDEVSSGVVRLSKGRHRIAANFQKASGKDAAFTLAWEKPGDTCFEVIPTRCLSH